METRNSVGVIDAPTLKDWQDQDLVDLIDVREIAEYETGYIPEAILVPLSDFDLNKIPKNTGKQLVLYCRSGYRSEIAGRILLKKGWSEVNHLGGGILEWDAANLPIARS